MLTSTRLKALIIGAVVLAVLSLAGIITLIAVWQKKLTPFQDYSVVIDAGSTHSKIFVYTWPADKSDGLGTTSRVKQLMQSCEVHGGAITDVVDPSEATIKEYFKSCMEKSIGEIPATRKARAMIFLGGTAGLRLFEMKSPNLTDKILSSTRQYFQTLGLFFRAPEYQVRIISGAEEGISGWTSTNILTQRLFSKVEPGDTYGVTEIGGASVQMTFYSPSATHEKEHLDLFRQKYDLYSHSYLCYGLEQIRLVYLSSLIYGKSGGVDIEDPCLQSGYNRTYKFDEIYSRNCTLNKYPPPSSLNSASNFTIIGTGNGSDCATTMESQFNRSVCNFGTCSFDNVYQPSPIPPQMNFFAIGNGWFATFNSLAANLSISKNKDGNYDLNSLTMSNIKKAIEAICNQPWGEIPNPDKFRPALCFNAMFQWKLFEYGFSMNDNNLKQFHIVNKIQSNDIGWTLGYMINQTNSLSPEYRPERLLTKSEFIGLLVFCIVVLIASVAGAVFLFQRFKQLKDRTAI